MVRILQRLVGPDPFRPLGYILLQRSLHILAADCDWLVRASVRRQANAGETATLLNLAAKFQVQRSRLLENVRQFDFALVFDFLFNLRMLLGPGMEFGRVRRAIGRHGDGNPFAPGPSRRIFVHR